MADELLAMAKELYGGRIADMAAERDRLLARIAGLERENRALWYACGKLRQGCGIGESVIRESAQGDAIPGEAQADMVVDLYGSADKVLGDIVPLAAA